MAETTALPHLFGGIISSKSKCPGGARAEKTGGMKQETYHVRPQTPVGCTIRTGCRMND